MKRLSILLLVLLSFILVMSVTADAQSGDTYYVKVASARVRSEPNTTGKIVANLKRNTAIVILEVVEGTRVSRSTVWYRIDVNGEAGYIHSSLVTSTPPRSTSGTGGSSGSSTGSGNSGSVTTPEPISTPIPQTDSGTSCPDITANCSALTCAQAYACLAAGHSGLDRDKDGVPCESVCSGG